MKTGVEIFVKEFETEFNGSGFCHDGDDVSGEVVSFDVDPHSLVEIVGSLAKVLGREGLAWSEHCESLDFVWFPQGEDPSCGSGYDDIVFGGRSGFEPLGSRVLACGATDGDRRRVPSMDAAALARAGGRFGHLLLEKRDHPGLMIDYVSDECL